MNIFIRWLLSTVAVIISAYLLEGVFISGIFSALVLAVILGLLNILVRPILLILTLPINILTLGLFTFVVNAVVILLASGLTPGFYVENFWWALLFSIILSIVNALLHRIGRS